jgi:hypothetical protein
LLKLHQGNKTSDNHATIDEPPMPDRLPNVATVTVDRRKFGAGSQCRQIVAPAALDGLPRFFPGGVVDRAGLSDPCFTLVS